NTMLEREAPENSAEAFKLLKADFDGKTKELKKLADKAGKCLSNVFVFCEKVFGEGHEMLILVTELTISHYGARFISRYGCKEYFAHNKELLFYERQKEIIAELEKLEL
ncbi:MAG: ATPase, partial [Clostridia bacterium]|nr:ATPase [Clostridia bacterium]